MPPLFRLHPTKSRLVLECDGRFVSAPASFTIDALFCSEDPCDFAAAAFERGKTCAAPAAAVLRAPIQSQEVWAAGVTYQRSKTARKQESKDHGGGTFYDRVYDAERPELFFKSTPHRVAAAGTPVRIRRDSQWNVPEPELTLAINSHGKIFGYTIGNDMGSRDIEGENPLYLPQAKIYDRSAALGPCLVISCEPVSPDTAIAIQVWREGEVVFEGETTIGRMKRPLPSLADWLFRENSFPFGCYLMTGTGVVPAGTFTLRVGDEIRITLEPVGTLINTVEV